jgi:transcriptional regulator
VNGSGYAGLFRLDPGAQSPDHAVLPHKMYNPPHFEESRPEELERIINEHPLGTLVYLSPDGLDATHLPFIYKKEIDGKEILVAHVARKNPIWQQVPDESEVLTIFHGADAYISPNWYPSKHESHRQVPTWNYQVVHVRGRIRFIQDVKFLRAAVALLTHLHETRAQEVNPWRMSDGDKEYIDEMLASIVGVEISITEITGKSKLSQNREPRDRSGAIEALIQKGEVAIADVMVKAQPGSGQALSANQ